MRRIRSKCTAMHYVQGRSGEERCSLRQWPHSDLKKRFGQVEKDKIEGTDRRKEKRKPVQTKLRIYMISFFSILVGLQHKPLSGADTVGSLPKLNLKLKYIIINITGDCKGSLINLN